MARLLTRDEFKATFAKQMVDVSAQECPQLLAGAMGFSSYVGTIPQSDLGEHRLKDGRVQSVYRGVDGRYEQLRHSNSS
ncbi:MAG: hypothetical protein QM706_11965 [Nitrospira sp.]